MQLTRSDFTGWKQADITKLFLAALQERYWEELNLLTTCNLDDVPFRRGYLQALQDTLNLDLDLPEEE